MSKRRISEFTVLVFAVVFILRSISPYLINNRHNETPKALTCAVAVDFGESIPDTSAHSAIVIDAKSRNVLYSKNADIPRGMASTTKIMTALVAIENSNINEEFLIPKEAVGIEGSSVYLCEGEPLTMRELLYCLLLESGNDAATAIAICCSGSEEAFVQLMNQKAVELELEYTHFSNPHGLSNPQHKTTARELAIITATAMEYPLFCEIVSCKTAKVRYKGIENGRSLTNHNKLLFGFEGAIGVKTGYTTTDGKCLVSAAERNGLQLIAVTLSDSNATNTHKTLLNNAFENFESRLIAKSGELHTYIPISNRKGEFIHCTNTDDVYVCLPKNAQYAIEITEEMIITAPLELGTIGAKAICRHNEKEVYIIILEATKEFK